MKELFEDELKIHELREKIFSFLQNFGLLNMKILMQLMKLWKDYDWIM
jgi:hypothetical protein